MRDDSRIKRLSEQLEDPCLIEQVDDLYYLTGLTLSKGRLLVKKGESILFVDGRYFEGAKKEASCTVCTWEDFKKIGEKRVLFDSASMTYDGYLLLKEGYPQIQWIPSPSPVKWLRAIKEPKEIAALKKAANLTWRGYQRVVACLKEGVSEEELALEFEFFCRKNGASGMSFMPIIAFGENSAYPHHRAGKSRLHPNQSVLVDVGAVVDHYCGDMTRLCYFGKPDPRIAEFEQIVKRVQKMAIDHVKPGIKAGELDQLVQDEFLAVNVKQQYKTPKIEAIFGGPMPNVKQLYIHSLGHGIGIECHEFPRFRFDGVDKDVVLKPGMVFTIEPGLYQPGVGGVRIEDMILVTETGHEKLI